MKIPIEYGKFYHIFNRGNNSENIFSKEQEYLHFMENYSIFIDPVADTFAWCLMNNHFHVLVRIKEKENIGFLDSRISKSEVLHQKWKVSFPDKPDKNFTRKPIPTEQFKHFFNSYSRWFNLRNKRTGSLFEKNFKRNLIDNHRYLQNMIIYIHQNPVKHGFVEHTLDYPWTSYLTITTEIPTKIKKDEVIDYFDDIDNFKALHEKPQDDRVIEQLIIE
nr:hypothetical protein [Bacteroidota bacterium]